MPFLRRLDLLIPWYITDSEVRCRRMALVLSLAVNLEHLQLLWPWGDQTRMSMAVQMLELRTWPRLREFYLLRSGAFDFIEIDSVYDGHCIWTLPHHLLKAFFKRHRTICDLQLRNILVGEFGDEPVLWDENLNSSPAVSPLRDILALLPLQHCSVVLDTFKYIAEEREAVMELDEDIESFW